MRGATRRDEVFNLDRDSFDTAKMDGLKSRVCAELVGCSIAILNGVGELLNWGGLARGRYFSRIVVVISYIIETGVMKKMGWFSAHKSFAAFGKLLEVMLCAILSRPLREWQDLPQLLPYPPAKRLATLP